MTGSGWGLRRTLIVVPVTVVFVVAGVGLFRARPDADIGGPAPAFTLPDLDTGAERSASDLLGRPAVVNFWASWCDPCRDEAPGFAAVAEAFEDDVAFLGVNILDGRREALDYVSEFGIGYPSVRDASGRVADRYGVAGVPETFFLDAAGAVVGRYIGAFTDGQLESLVRDLIDLRPGGRLDITGRGETRPVP